MAYTNANYIKSGSTSNKSTVRNTSFSIGVESADDYGPTSQTGFWKGILPPPSGYTIYMHKESQGPSIHVANDDSQCIFFLKSFGATGDTISEVINWSTGRTDIWVQTQPITVPDLETLTPFAQLETIATYLRSYMSDFRNPSFYAYQLDGDGYHISDGGGDMYDSGNVTSPWIISNISYTGSSGYSIMSYPHAVNYQNSGTTQMIDTSFGYLGLGYEQYTGGIQSLTYLPLTVLGSRDNDTYGSGLPIGFQSGGNSGADGGGTLAEGNIYTGDTVSGFTVHSYYRQTYNAGDPSHCDLFILLGHPTWNSTFGTVYYGGAPTNQGSNGSYLYTSGVGTKNILTIKTLLSKNSGVQVTFNEVKDVVDKFILRVKESQSF